MNIDLKEIFKDVNINSETAVKAISDYCTKEVNIAKMKYEIQMCEQKRKDLVEKHSIINSYVAWIVIPSIIFTFIILAIKYSH